MKRKRWIRVKEDLATASTLHEVLGIDEIIAKIMANRGINSVESAQIFLNPSFETISSPINIPQLKDAAVYIISKIDSGAKICIYGDYDADGITATALLTEAIEMLGARENSYYLPKRLTEGYGLNKEAVLDLKNQGVSLIITVDCGVSDKEVIAYGNSLGLEFVVTDHHNPPAELPEARYIVNPKMIDGYSPEKNIAGVGVAFKLAMQMFDISPKRKREESEKFLDLVAIGTIADIVPLLDENRILAIKGLEILNNNKRIGIKALQDVSGLKSDMVVRDISFGIAPRLNAAGRLKHAAIACDLLLEKNNSRAYEIARNLNKINQERQAIGLEIQQDILSKISGGKVADEKFIMLASKDWHPGIIGITAAQLCRMFNRPAGLIAIMDDTGRGSMRSLPGIDIFDILIECQDLLVEYGGHKEAAGFEIKIENIEPFIKKYTEIFANRVSFDDLVSVLEIDMDLDVKDITLDMAKKINKLSPFGQANAKPIFSTKNLSVFDYRKVGSDQRHLKLSLVSGDQTFEAIAFGMGDFAEEIINIPKAEIAFNLDINRWQGNETLQLNVLDIKEVSE